MTTKLHISSRPIPDGMTAEEFQKLEWVEIAVPAIQMPFPSEDDDEYTYCSCCGAITGYVEDGETE